MKTKQDAIFALRGLIEKLRDFDRACRDIGDRELRVEIRDAFPVGIAIRSMSELAAKFDRELGTESPFLGSDIMQVPA